MSLKKSDIKIANKYHSGYDQVIDRHIDSLELDHNFRTLAENIVALCEVLLNPDDYIELYTKNETNSANVTLVTSNLIISEV